MNEGPIRATYYVAHPLNPIEGETFVGNLDRAVRWLGWLMDRYPDSAFCAPWIPMAWAAMGRGVERDPDVIERALRDDVEFVRMCGAIVLVGGRVSPGMRREMDAAIADGLEVADMTGLGDEPPGSRPALTGQIAPCEEVAP